jgi:isocitrate dehydrogenase kinase/phosphatase
VLNEAGTPNISVSRTTVTKKDSILKELDLLALMADTDAWEKVSFENDEDAPIPFMRSAESRANE